VSFACNKHSAGYGPDSIALAPLYNVAMSKLRIFLSHVTVESKLADILRVHLLRDFIGLVEIFESSDRLSIPAGSKWLTEVTSALKNADMHVILCSPESRLRPWIQFEAGAAHLRGIPIIPVCHSGLTSAQLPVPMSESEGLEASDPDGLRALYQAIASALGSDVPPINFDAFADEVETFEIEYRTQHAMASAEPTLHGSIEQVHDPKALCISSQQFLRLGFENQLQVVLNAFPSVMEHQQVLSSEQLRDAIAGDRTFDIVHIAAFVCPRTGDLYFSDVDVTTGKRLTREADLLKADALADLLQVAKTKLVVIGSCDSIALGATLVNVCHVVAARDMVSPKMMAAWVEAFYSKLPQRSLLQALDYALKLSQAPMRFYARQVNDVDLIFMQDAAQATATAPRAN
jgi:hypothetical protein